MSKRNEIYDFIIQRLVKAHYGFGDRLLVKELSQETGASRQPIMSALNRLSVDGFVRIIPQVGCEVVDPTPSQIADFFIMFQRMEGLLAELAAERRTAEQMQSLRAIQMQLSIVDGNGSDVDSYVRLNREFHNTIHAMANSPLLDQKQRNNFNMCDFFITHSSGFEVFQKDAIAEHEQIIDAIDRKQTERARLVAESHIAAIASSVLAGLGEPVSDS
ncbi:MAG: GntR family transcriptional regulator [Sphingomonadaceae bacterium]|nr:GntR family transcriptional regulator [Sphingomonadaceae bacterium]MCB2086248.1 GntR family transcriptional regulator [Sphingomonadaceae bacterium]MCC0011689.1 GntR family transcriptional regulator [Rhodobiaceae bacterium]MCP5384511.1 GntR family transcriptional regulator [Altererythrobacter sp.]MCP5395091.1 GntR family transcriptional regulator [Sphingomonadaceae bacterium]